MQFAKKLKTYRSTGDLHQFVDPSSNARERMTHEVEPSNQLVSPELYEFFIVHFTDGNGGLMLL